MLRPGDRTDRVGNTMLHLAIREGLTDLALYLVARGADSGATFDTSRTPLMQAVLKKQTPVVEALLEAHADVHARDYLGNTALAYALQQGDDRLSARLLSAGDHTNQLTAFVGMAPTFCGRLVELRSSTRPCPVLRCCISRMPLTAAALLSAGVPAKGEVWEVDAGGRTALHYAYAHEMHDVVAALIANGACE